MSDYEEETGYDLNDPKHPTFAERYADHADHLRKRGKEVRAEPMYELVLPETDRLLAESETLEGILNAAATISEEEDIGGAVVLRGGEFDANATLMAQEKGLAV